MYAWAYIIEESQITGYPFNVQNVMLYPGYSFISVLTPLTVTLQPHTLAWFTIAIEIKGIL